MDVSGKEITGQALDGVDAARAALVKEAQAHGLPVSYIEQGPPPVLQLPPPAPVVSVHPVVLAAPGRGEDLHVRVSAPTQGRDLPIIVFSHGSGSSALGYGPLADFWAAHGFVVIQPTHLDSRTVSVPPQDPRIPLIWRYRVADDVQVLDNLDTLEAAVPGLAGRTDRSRIAAAGHSFGGQTAGNLLGLRVPTVDAPRGEDHADPRVRAGVLLATAGEGGDNLTAFAKNFDYLNPTFAHLTTPSLVVAGDRDDLPFTVRGPAWCMQPYHLSPGAGSLLTLFGAEHSLGGIAGYDAKETTDEDPARVALVQQVTWAFLRHALGVEEDSWRTVRGALARPHSLGQLEHKQ